MSRCHSSAHAVRVISNGSTIRWWTINGIIKKNAKRKRHSRESRAHGTYKQPKSSRSWSRCEWECRVISNGLAFGWQCIDRYSLKDVQERENIVVDLSKESFFYLPSEWKSTQPLKSLKCESDREVRCNLPVVSCIIQPSDDWLSPNLVSVRYSVKVSEHATSRWFRVVCCRRVTKRKSTSIACARRV